MPKEKTLNNEVGVLVKEEDFNLSFNLTTPTESNHIANKDYVDSQDQGILKAANDYSDDKKQDKLILGGNPSSKTYLKWENDEKTQLTINNSNLNNVLETKQDKLTAGEGIIITANEISNSLVPEMKTLKELIGEGSIDEINNNIISSIKNLQAKISALESKNSKLENDINEIKNDVQKSLPIVGEVKFFKDTTKDISGWVRHTNFSQLLGYSRGITPYETGGTGGDPHYLLIGLQGTNAGRILLQGHDDKTENLEIYPSGIYVYNPNLYAKIKALVDNQDDLIDQWYEYATPMREQQKQGLAANYLEFDAWVDELYHQKFNKLDF